jgi:hypothetical protein
MHHAIKLSDLVDGTEQAFAWQIETWWQAS